MKLTNPITGGMAALCLSGALLMGGCTEEYPDSPTAQVNQSEMDEPNTVPRSPVSDLRTRPMTEPYQTTRMEDERDQSLADRDFTPMTLPELETKVDSVQNTLNELRPRAEMHDELDDFEDLQEKTSEVARELNEAQPQVEDRDELTEDVLEVEAELAEFENELSEDL